MLYFIVLSASMLTTWLLIGIAGAVYDASNRATWQRIARDCEVSRG